MRETKRRHDVRAMWLIGIVAMAPVALAFHREPQAEGPARPGQPPAEVKTLPPELDALNIASRKMYAGARARELSAIPVVIIVSGDELVLRKNGTRTAVTVLPAEYHALKCVAHTTLALFGHLSEEPGRPLSEERLKILKEHQALAAAAGAVVEKFGFDAEALARQKRLLARTEELTAAVLRDGKASAEDLTKFCRAARAV